MVYDAATDTGLSALVYLAKYQISHILTYSENETWFASSFVQQELIGNLSLLIFSISKPFSTSFQLGELE